MSRAKTLIYPTSTTPLPMYPAQHNQDRTTTISAFAMLSAGTLQSALAAAGHGCQIGVGDGFLHCWEDKWKWKWKYQSNWTWSKAKTVSTIRDRMKGLGKMLIYQTQQMTLES
jgi:hypothetical protein